MITKIIGTGSYLPSKRVTNEDLSKIVDTNDEWIVSRTGIKERRVVEQESVIELATKAGRQAIEQSGISLEEIDLILVATMSSDFALPNVASSVQACLKAVNAIAIDMNTACSGFIFALSVADSYIRAGIYRTVLIIGAETLSRIVDWNDRGTCILFGDGAGAVIAKASSQGRFEQVLYTDGSSGNCLAMKKEEKNHSFITMNGQKVFRFAVKKVPEVIEELLQQTKTKKEQIKYFLLHQANKRIIHAVSEKLSVPIERFPMNLQWYGNTSAASIPILLDEMNRKNLLERGDSIILSGFGGGLTWGSILLQW